jgi:hypothetical protein
MHGYYTLNVPVLQIGKSYIVAHKEGKPRIVILKIESFAHSLGQLVDKTENTPVVAGAFLIHEISLKLQSYIGVPVLTYPDFKKNTVSGQPQVKSVLENKKSVIKNVFDLMPVYGVKLVPGFDPRLIRGRAGNYFIHGYHNGKLL